MMSVRSEDTCFRKYAFISILSVANTRDTREKDIKNISVITLIMAATCSPKYSFERIGKHRNLKILLFNLSYDLVYVLLAMSFYNDVNLS